MAGSMSPSSIFIISSVLLLVRKIWKIFNANCRAIIFHIRVRVEIPMPNCRHNIDILSESYTGGQSEPLASLCDRRGLHKTSLLMIADSGLKHKGNTELCEILAVSSVNKHFSRRERLTHRLCEVLQQGRGSHTLEPLKHHVAIVSTRVPVGDWNPLVHLAVDELEGDQVGDKLRVNFGIEGAKTHDDLVLLGVIGADDDVSLLQINVLVRESDGDIKQQAVAFDARLELRAWLTETAKPIFKKSRQVVDVGQRVEQGAEIQCPFNVTQK
jgi:hypothetical protein